MTASCTSVVLLTPAGRGAVATLLVEGPDALAAVESQFFPADRRLRLGDFPCGRIVFGRWGKGGEEVVICRFDERQVELSCHGGRLAAERIERDLVEQGCQRLDWQQREYGSSLLQREAETALAQARTQRTAAILLDQLQGALQREVAKVCDVAAGNPEQACQDLQTLLDRSDIGLHLTTPWRIVLAGRPNVGKSSLINALLGYSRSIVFDQPGTTRDVVTATAAIDGWPVEFTDMAGLRESNEALEAAGIERAQAQMAAADVLILVFDATEPWTTEDSRLSACWPDALILFNKCDLIAAIDDRRPSDLTTSAVTRQGMDGLLAAIVSRIVPQMPPAGSGVPFTPRQLGILDDALSGLRAERVEEAVQCLAAL